MRTGTDGGDVWISPNTVLSRDAHQPGSFDKIRLTIPTGKPVAKPTPFPDPLVAILEDVHAAYDVSVRRLGELRFEIFKDLGIKYVDSEVGNLDEANLQNLADEVVNLALSVSRALHAAKFSDNPPVVIFNTDTDVSDLIGRTLLWADHIVVQDKLFDAIVRGQPIEKVTEALADQFRNQELIKLGVMVPVPTTLAEAVTERSILRETERDLSDPTVSDWVRRQLVFEGPTAREVLLVAAQDELEPWVHIWAYVRKITNIDGGILVTKPFEGAYDPSHNYSPWISQTQNDAIGNYVQDVNTSLAIAHFFGGSYVNRSLFHSRLLSKIGAPEHPAQAAVWSPSPYLAHADPIVLAKALSEHEAVDSLRRKTAMAVRNAESFTEKVWAITEMDEELAEEARELPGRLKRSAGWSSLNATIGVGLFALGASKVNMMLMLAGAANIAKDMLPLIEKSKDMKRGASWIYHSTRPNTERKGKRRLR